MNDKTERLRDIFVEATGSDTVTESQQEGPGTLADERDVDERVEAVVERMRERYAFRTDLDTPALRRVAEGYHADESDAELADALDVDEATVVTARLDLHLVRESDRDAPFDLGELRSCLVERAGVAACAEAFDADHAEVQRYRDVVEADLASTRANGRFRDEFAELLTDADLSTRHARDAREDGLRDATEDLETDVSF